MNAKKVLTRAVSFITALVVGSLVATSAIAAPVSNQSVELKQLSAKYGLRDGTLPKGVKPLKFDSVAEADAFLKKMNMDVPAQPITLKQPVANSNIGACTLGEDSQMVRFWVFGWVSGYTTYEYIWDDKQKCNVYDECYSVSSGMSGITVGFTYDQVSGSTWSQINDNGKTLKTGFTGHITYYLIIKGVIKVGEDTRPYTVTYTNP